MEDFKPPEFKDLRVEARVNHGVVLEKGEQAQGPTRFKSGEIYSPSFDNILGSSSLCGIMLCVFSSDTVLADIKVFTSNKVPSPKEEEELEEKVVEPQEELETLQVTTTYRSR